MKPTDKEKWIDQVMQSLEGIQRTEAPSGMYSRIEAKMRSGKIIALAAVDYIPLRRIGIAAASISLLFFINFYSIGRETRRSASQNSVEKTLNYYQLSDNDLLYKI